MNDEARFCPTCGKITEEQQQEAPQQNMTAQQYSAQPQMPQNHHQDQQMQYRPQPQRHPRPAKVEKGPNPVEQAVVNFADKYCGYGSLGWALGLCLLSLALLIFYNGGLLNFSGVLYDITYKINDILPAWVVMDIMQLSMLYVFMHLVNALYKAGGTWPLLYITPCVWVVTLVLFSILCLTKSGTTDDLSNIQSLLLASYICVGIVGILCSKIEVFSWTGKVVIISAICWIIYEVSYSMIPFIFFALSTIWYVFEINSRVRHYFNDYYYSSEGGYYQEDTAYSE